MKVHGTRDIALEVGSVSERWKRTFKHVRMPTVALLNHTFFVDRFRSFTR